MKNIPDNPSPSIPTIEEYTPLVSVLMACYNTTPEHLHDSIKSILNQTFTNFEFLILNDSPDNVEIKKIVESYKDSRIVYLSNEINLGISQSRNRLLKVAKGDYLAIFDHDDISVPTRLEKEVKYLNNNSCIGVVSSNLQFFPNYKVTNYPENSFLIKHEMITQNALPHTAMMIRKNLLLDNNIEYEEIYSPAEDYMLVLRLMKYTEFYNFPEPLVLYRWHESNATKLLKDKMGIAGERIKSAIKVLYPNLVKYNKRYKVWVWLFFFIPFIKIKISKEKVYSYYLFGFIPLIKYKK